MIVIRLLWIGLFLTPLQLFAGAVVTTSGRATIGDVSEDDAAIYLKVKYGKTKIKKANVLWHTADKRVTSLYIAGALAMRDGHDKVARFLLEESLKQEPKYAAKTKKRLELLKKKNMPDKATSPTLAPSTHKRAEKKVRLKHNDVTKMVKGDLVSSIDGKLETFDDSVLPGRKYYAVYYSAHWCGPCRSFTPKLVKFYDEMKEEHGDDFEIIFYSYDNSGKEMESYMAGEKMKWPAIEYDKLKSSELRSYAGRGIPCLIILDPDSEVIAHTYKDGKKVQGADDVLAQLRELLAAADDN